MYLANCIFQVIYLNGEDLVWWEDQCALRSRRNKLSKGANASSVAFYFHHKSQTRQTDGLQSNTLLILMHFWCTVLGLKTTFAGT